MASSLLFENLILNELGPSSNFLFTSSRGFFSFLKQSQMLLLLTFVDVLFINSSLINNLQIFVSLVVCFALFAFLRKGIVVVIGSHWIQHN